MSTKFEIASGIGQRLRQARQKKEWSLKQASVAAEEMGMRFPAIVLGSYERGEREPVASRIPSLLRLYDIDANWLFTGEHADGAPKVIVDELQRQLTAMATTIANLTLSSSKPTLMIVNNTRAA